MFQKLVIHSNGLKMESLESIKLYVGFTPGSVLKDDLDPDPGRVSRIFVSGGYFGLAFTTPPPPLVERF